MENDGIIFEGQLGKGKLCKVYNKNKGEKEPVWFWCTIVEYPDGREEPLLITPNILNKIEYVTKKESEDIPGSEEKNIVQKILDYLN